MKKILLSTFVAAAFAAGSANAQTIASDNGGNYSGGWTNGANGGFGFQPWSLSAAAGATNLIGNPADAGIGTAGIGTTAFGMRATQSGNYAGASRSLTTALNIGDTFSFNWGVNWDTDGAGNNKGFNLLAGASELFNVNMAGSSAITINGIDAGFGFGTDPMLVSVGRTVTGYNFSLSSRSGGSPYVVSLATNVAINAVSFYAANNNDAVNRNMYFNNLQVVPEPSTYALLTLSALALGGYAARRRARK
jgi:hypothetical protein